MEMWWWWWLRLIVAAAAASARWQAVSSDNTDFHRLGVGCSSRPATNASEFNNSLGAAFSVLRTQLQSSEDTRYATAHTNSTQEPTYALVQCRNFMSRADCLACYDRLREDRNNIRQCTDANYTGGRAASDGCFLSKRSVGESSTVYGVAQCALGVSEEGCRGCLTAALQSLKDACLLSMSDGRVVDAACFMRYSHASFFLDNQTTNLEPFLHVGGINVGALIGGTVGGAVLLLILVTTFLWFKFSRQLKRALIANILGATELQNPNTYSYKDLKEATNNFSEENKLGSGGFGTVYKGTLRNKSVVAVKKMDMMRYNRAKADYESEVRLISNVHHRNLVRLLGYCSKGSELLLVYEYMENKSLDRFLYGENRGTLSWKQRIDIIFGTARGIAYLHEHYYTTIIHRDIMPGNILLDSQFQAKLADFGLARLLLQNQTHLSTGFAGTLGYTAPEYAVQGHLSEKVDIYSFGIVILEIISGRKCSDVIPGSTTEYLLREAWKQYERGTHRNLADEALELEEHEGEQLEKMVDVAMMCVQSQPSSRPTMSQIIIMISSEGSMGVIRRPSFGYENGFAVKNSNATASLTHFTGR